MARSTRTGAKACVPNPALQPLEFLIGEWLTTGTHPMVPDEELRGRSSFSWHEGGAFLIVRTEVDHPSFPDGLAIIGSDDAAGTFAMTYFDERGTSRLFEVAVGPGRVAWRRDHPDFSQSTILTAEDGDRLVGTGRMKEKGGDWADDLSQVYSRSHSSTAGAGR